MSAVTSWSYPSVTVYVKRALVSSRSPIGAGVNCTLPPTITAWPRLSGGCVTPTITSGSRSGSKSLASTSTATDDPTTTVSESAVSTGGRFGSASSITSTSTDPRVTPPRPSVTSYWNGRRGAAPVRRHQRQLRPLDAARRGRVAAVRPRSGSWRRRRDRGRSPAPAAGMACSGGHGWHPAGSRADG